MLLAACGGGEEGAGTQGGGAGQKVNFNVYQGTPYTWLVVLAQSQGFFARNAIDAKLVPTESGPAAIAGLVSGDLQFVSGDIINGGTPMGKGIPLKLVSGLMRGKQQVLVAPTKANLPDTFPENVRGLKGKPFGIVAPGSATNYYANMILDAAGMTPEDVKYATTTALPANIGAALRSGRVDAAIGPLPVMFGLVNSGQYEVLFNLDTVTNDLFRGDDTPSPADLPQDAPLSRIADLVHQYLWTTGSYAESNEKTITNVQQALIETANWLQAPENLKKAVDWLIENQQVTAVPGVTEEQTRKFLEVTLPLLVAHAPPDDVSVYQDVWVGAGVLPKAIPVKEFIHEGVAASPDDVAKRAESGAN